ncbi:uncharacterized protein EAE97_003909 [Botrytis byssoidea]|uniref:Uncharacterized protein n=1 Tax=Botrytis byssoidea TaxID=139641 RepID=A0A9P5M6X9_9HELO|nr:uncharacterized protein EAE97_003909 [Botrytis byssoidea]KAF7948498.1 hypothetical protein EAE97_003909 [Botrytis byssoidea]
MEPLRVSNDREFEPPDFSFQDHGVDLRLYDPSRVSSRDRRNSQYSVTDSLLSTPNRPESWQQVSSISSSSTAQSTNLNLPAQPLQNTHHTVIWKINWQQPTFMCSALLCGLILAIGHHAYYNSLSGTPAGDATRQAWSIRFGTAFAFLVVACFKAITVSALGQYLWSVVRSKGLKISDLDRLFALTSNPISLFSVSVIKNASLAALLGTIFWTMDFVSFAPAATLSVVPVNITISMPIPVLNGTKFLLDTQSPEAVVDTRISEKIAQKSASLADVVPLNFSIAPQIWSYNMQFFGLTLKCREAKSTEQAIFDQLVHDREELSVFVVPQINDSIWNNTMSESDPKLRYLLLYFSLRTVALYDSSSLYELYVNKSTAYHIFVQSSTSSIVCTAMNASISVTIASVYGNQEITQHSTQYLNEIPLCDGSPSCLVDFYQFSNFEEVLQGNITLREGVAKAGTYGYDMVPVLIDNPLLRLFTACDDVQASPFGSLYSPSSSSPRPIEDIFKIEPWQCRNRTFMRAIEDLSINITIGYLGSPNLTSSSTEYANITTLDTRNIYVYHPLYLVLSYSIGFFLASLCGAIGLYSMHVNGVSHSNSFSAIMLTTRNPDLDILARGKSLGSDPLSKSIKNTKLRFGPLLSQQAPDKIGSDESPRHVAFGFEGNVDELKKGGKYI